MFYTMVRPVEGLPGFVPMIGYTRQRIADMVLSFLEENGYDINNCRGQAYDNARLQHEWEVCWRPKCN